MTGFELHPRLDADTMRVTTLDLCQVLLMKDSRYPWLVLVPEIPGLRDLHDLESDDQVVAIKEIDRVSRALQKIYKPDKMNVAALGNMVPQLHIHIIARFVDDAAWPAPVWGIGDPEPYTADALVTAVTEVSECLTRPASSTGGG